MNWKLVLKIVFYALVVIGVGSAFVGMVMGGR